MTDFKITYRNTNPKDLDKLLRFTDRWIGKNYFSKEELRLNLLKGIKGDMNASFLATIEDTIIGARITYAPGEWIDFKNMNQLTVGAWDEEIKDVAYFKSLFVHEKYQNKGIGSKLSEMSLFELKKMNAKAVVAHAWVESPNNSSQKYLEKMGFKKIAVHERFWYFNEYDCPRCGIENRCVCSAAEMLLKL